MIKKEYILVGLIAILIIFMSFLFTKEIMKNMSKKESKETSMHISNNTKKQNIVPIGKVGIISHKYNKPIIEVIIKNNTGNTIKQVKVTAHCWDKQGNNIGDSANGEYNVNTTDTYKINIFCKADTARYELELNYE